MPQPNGIDALTRRRQERTARDQQKLEPKRKNPGAGTIGDPRELPVNVLAHNPTNKRDSAEYADSELDGLAASMEKVGVLQELGVVRRELWLSSHPDQAKDLPDEAQWIVRYGNRRLAAARKAKLDTVPVKVVDALEGTGRGHAAQIIENIHHRALDPLAEAADVDELVGEYGSQAEVARSLGKSKGWVTQRLNLLNLVPQLQAALKGGELTLRDARILGAIPEVKQMAVYEAGPPYRDQVKARTPSAGVTPGAPETYSRSELPATTGPAGAASRAGATAETDHGATQPASAPETGDAPEPAAAVEFSSGTSHTAALIPVEPVELAKLIRAHLQSDAVAELVRLLNET